MSKINVTKNDTLPEKSTLFTFIIEKKTSVSAKWSKINNSSVLERLT
jgi:hypothetical protein